MTFYLWDFMYQIIGIMLSIVVIIFIYNIYIVSKKEMAGNARTG